MKHLLNFNELHEDFSKYLTEEDLELTDEGVNELLSDDISEFQMIYMMMKNLKLMKQKNLVLQKL
jgi:hypothetical protein